VARDREQTTDILACFGDRFKIHCLIFLTEGQFTILSARLNMSFSAAKAVSSSQFELALRNARVGDADVDNRIVADLWIIVHE
jgi:hypothetical protein